MGTLIRSCPHCHNTNSVFSSFAQYQSSSDAQSQEYLVALTCSDCNGGYFVKTSIHSDQAPHEYSGDIERAKDINIVEEYPKPSSNEAQKLGNIVVPGEIQRKEIPAKHMVEEIVKTAMADDYSHEIKFLLKSESNTELLTTAVSTPYRIAVMGEENATIENIVTVGGISHQYIAYNQYTGELGIQVIVSNYLGARGIPEISGKFVPMWNILLPVGMHILDFFPVTAKEEIVKQFRITNYEDLDDEIVKSYILTHPLVSAIPNIEAIDRRQENVEYVPHPLEL